MVFKDNANTDYKFAIIKRKFENFGSEKILNEFGQIIGKIILPFFNPNKNIIIQDSLSKKVILIEERKSLFYKRKVLKSS